MVVDCIGLGTVPGSQRNMSGVDIRARVETHIAARDMVVWRGYWEAPSDVNKLVKSDMGYELVNALRVNGLRRSMTVFEAVVL